MVSSCLPSLAPLKRRKKTLYFPAGTKLLPNTGLSFFVKSSKADRKHQAWGTVLSKFSHVLACPAKQMSQQTPPRRWQISVLMPSRLSRYLLLELSSIYSPTPQIQLAEWVSCISINPHSKADYLRGNNEKYWSKLQNFISIAEMGRNKGIPQIKI